MKFTFKKTVRIHADIDVLWRVVTNQRFEQDFLPEVSRSSGASAQPTRMAVERKLTWESGGETNIALARKDLNVRISKVQIGLEARGDDVYVTLQVAYAKRLETHFVKAHKAVKHLFTNKLRVLKADLDFSELELAFNRI